VGPVTHASVAPTDPTAAPAAGTPCAALFRLARGVARKSGEPASATQV